MENTHFVHIYDSASGNWLEIGFTSLAAAQAFFDAVTITVKLKDSNGTDLDTRPLTDAV